MSWIKEYSKGCLQIYQGNVLEGFQPIDFFHFYPQWYDLLVAGAASAIQKLGLEKKSYHEIQHLLPGPSNIRAILQKIIPTYGANPTKQKEYRLVANFMAKMLEQAVPEDPFGISSNRIKLDTKQLLKTIPWKDTTALEARHVGQFITAASSLVHGVYNDLTTDFGWDIYGPYYLNLNGKKHSLIIRHFPDLRPNIWPEKYLPGEHEILLYALYENLEWDVKFVGCHAVPKGSPVQAMRKTALMVDGKSVDDFSMITDEFIQKATLVYQHLQKMSFEKLKVRVMQQECYQFKKILEAAGMDWQPTQEMLDRVKGKPLLKDIFPKGKLITTVEEFEKVFFVQKFAKEVLRETEK